MFVYNHCEQRRSAKISSREKISKVKTAKDALEKYETTSSWRSQVSQAHILLECLNDKIQLAMLTMSRTGVKTVVTIMDHVLVMAQNFESAIR